MPMYTRIHLCVRVNACVNINRHENVTSIQCVRFSVNFKALAEGFLLLKISIKKQAYNTALLTVSNFSKN